MSNIFMVKKIWNKPMRTFLIFGFWRWGIVKPLGYSWEGKQYKPLFWGLWIRKWK